MKPAIPFFRPWVVAAISLCWIDGAGAQANPAADAETDKLARCAIEKHPNEVRWLNALLAKKVALDEETGPGARMNSLAGISPGCLEGKSDADVAAVVVALGKATETDYQRSSSAGPMDELADCLVRSAPGEALAFVRQSDMDALRLRRFGAVSHDALASLLKRGGVCDGIVRKLGDRLQGNQLYSRINWLVRAAPLLGAQE